MEVDGDLICFHQGNEGELAWSSPADAASWPADYPSARYRGRYGIINARQLLEALREAPGVYLVTDTKGDNRDVLRRFAATAHEIDDRLVDRIIPQIYHPNEAAMARDIAPFPRIILTLYKWGGTDAEVLEAVESLRIAAVTMPAQRFSAELAAQLRRANALTYVHTLNDADEIANLVEQGLHGVYTDFDTSLLVSRD